MPNRSAPEEAKRGNEVNMSHFYFVRHGQTVWNVENKICGATDSPLTDKGHEQARVTGRILRDKIDHGEIHIDEILTSPLSRAYDTAVEISRIIQVPVQAEPRLTEQNFGKWEGTARNGAEFAKAKENFVDSYGGGESMMRLAQRIYNLIDDIRKEPEKTYLLVAHNGISRMIESYFRDMSNEEFAAFGIKNAEVVEYQFDGIVPDCSDGRRRFGCDDPLQCVCASVSDTAEAQLGRFLYGQWRRADARAVPGKNGLCPDSARKGRVRSGGGERPDSRCGEYS